MTTLRISTASDVPKIVRQVMGFEPTESVVLLGLGGGPCARVDIASLDSLVPNLLPAVKHWGNGVIAVVYSDKIGAKPATDLLTNLTALLGVRALAIGVVGHGWVTIDGKTDPYSSDGRTRDAVAADLVAAVMDPDEADREAELAYEAGNGALAWLYIDRAAHLRGSTSEAAERLTEKLLNAIDPRGDR